MIATEDKRSEYPSEPGSQRRVPLAAVPTLSSDVLDSVLRRLVPAPLTRQAPSRRIHFVYLTQEGTA